MDIQLLDIRDLIPAGCRVETYGNVATIHDTKGEVIAVLCANKNNLELARMIAALPALIEAMDNAIDRGLLLPVLYGLRALDRAVFQPRPQSQPQLLSVR